MVFMMVKKLIVRLFYLIYDEEILMNKRPIAERRNI